MSAKNLNHRVPKILTQPPSYIRNIPSTLLSTVVLECISSGLNYMFRNIYRYYYLNFYFTLYLCVYKG